MTGLDPNGQWDIHRYGEVTSTMDVAARLIADGAIGGPAVVVADHQTAGRGRSDRAWRSVPGLALQLTAILEVPVPLAGLGPVPLLAGVAVAEALEALDPRLDVALKWPNDVLVMGRKVAGILIVSRTRGDVALLQIGIGINVVTPSDGGEAGALDRLVASPSAADAVVALRERLLGEVLRRLASLPIQLASDGGADGLRRWSRRAILVGEPVIVQDGDRRVEGKLLGVNEQGALRIETRPGRVSSVVAGDLTRGPRLQLAASATSHETRTQ